MRLRLGRLRIQLAGGVPHTCTYIRYHKRSDAVVYHEPGESASVLDAISEAINYDGFRLRNKGRTHFDDLLEGYSIGDWNYWLLRLRGFTLHEKIDSFIISEKNNIVIYRYYTVHNYPAL